jgi:hypothetical protein
MPSAKIHSVSGDASLALGFVLQNCPQLAAQQFSPIQGALGGAVGNGFVLQNSTNAPKRYGYLAQDASSLSRPANVSHRHNGFFIESLFDVIYGL